MKLQKPLKITIDKAVEATDNFLEIINTENNASLIKR